jgi:hypothetical protein
MVDWTVLLIVALLCAWLGYVATRLWAERGGR